MISDAIPKTSAAMASPKKRRGNRSAKLKQCKLDARREQWLSQVKSKGERDEVSNVSWDGKREPVCLESRGSFPMEELELKQTVQNVLYGSGSSEHHYSDSEPNPPRDSSSILGSNDCGLSASTRCSSRSGRSSSSSCSGSFSVAVSGDDDGDAGEEDDCLDDWETMADELAAAEFKQQEQEHQHISPSGSGSAHSEEHEDEITSQSQPFCGTRSPFSEKQTGGTDLLKAYVNTRAWRPDDSFRPQGLPNLSKQYSFVNSKQGVKQGYPLWGSVNSSRPVPSSCPICCEDLDCTDSNFIPCSCGFKLCLFCHKRILEDDGRCPGCRKQYGFALDDNATLNIGA